MSSSLSPSISRIVLGNVTLKEDPLFDTCDTSSNCGNKGNYGTTLYSLIVV